MRWFSKDTAGCSLIELLDNQYRPRRLPGAEHQASIKEYRTAINNFSAYLERDATIADFCDEKIEGCAAWLVERGRAASTANKTARHLKSLWLFARKKLNVDLPDCGVKFLREPKREPQAWTPDEARRIVAAAGRRTGMIGAAEESVWWQTLVLMLLSTGLRINALRGVPTTNYDRRRRMILAPAEVQKHGADQWLELLPSAADCLERLAPWERKLERLLDDWPYDCGRKAKSADTMRLSYKQLLVEAGLYPSVDEIPGYKNAFHKLRKTFATQVASKAGRDAAQRLLGHSASIVTDRYLDPRLMPRPNIVELVDDPLAPSSATSAETGQRATAVLESRSVEAVLDKPRRQPKRVRREELTDPHGVRDREHVIAADTCAATCRAPGERPDARSSRRKGNDIAAVRARLRASKAAAEAKSYGSGYADGEEWARHTAEYVELERLARLRGQCEEPGAFAPDHRFGCESDWLARAVGGPDEAWDVWKFANGVDADGADVIDEERLRGFICGALAVFDEAGV